MEILAPAGSPAALKAAVYNGADAVYLGASDFNARRGADNFAVEDLKQYISFCRQRGVKVHAVLNTLVSDREMDDALDLAQKFVLFGADALIVQDLGLFAELKKRTNIPMHASTQLTVHSLDGALFMKEIGFDRVVLSRELSARDIAYITQRADIETEVFVHGALCMCYSGQCGLSSVIGGRSGNRGACAQPCRLPYEGGYRLSLKDQCLLKYVSELAQMGVASLKIEGRMKGADYVGAVCRAYADAKRGKPYDEQDEAFLADIFSRDGFTDGYYTEKPGAEMFGVRGKNEARYKFSETEYKRFCINVDVSFLHGQASLSAHTDDGLAFETACSYEPAISNPTDSAQLRAVFSRLGGTVYYPGDIRVSGEKGFIPVSVLNRMRREMTQAFTKMRMLSGYTFKSAKYVLPERVCAEPVTEALFLSPENVPDNIDQCDRLWLPVMQVGTKKFLQLIERYKDRCGVFLPPAVHDSERAAFDRALLQARQMGVRAVLCGNVGQAASCRSMGFEVCADTGLNIFNTASAQFWRAYGLNRLTLSYELNLAQARDVRCENCGIIAYGRLPVMVMRNCIKKHCHKPEFLQDRKRQTFLVTCDYGCKNRLWNSAKLYMADKDLSGFSFIRLLFTDETAAQAHQVIQMYFDGADTVPEGITRGLYYRKV